MSNRAIRIDRREFLSSATRFLLGTCGLLALSSCGSENDEANANGDCSDGAATNYTNPGHSHSEIHLTASQIAAAIAGNYTLLGGGHSHAFSLSASDFTTLQSGGTLSKVDLEGDGHTITIGC